MAGVEARKGLGGAVETTPDRETIVPLANDFPIAGGDLPRVTYWTGVWDPRREAMSKQVAALRARLSPRGPVVAYTPQSSALVWPVRVLRLNQNRWRWLRCAALSLERRGDVTHIFGGLDAAHFLLLLGRRPILFTVAIPGEGTAAHLYGKVARFVAESRPIAAALRRAGVPDDRIEIIYPGINLARFRPQPVPTTTRFRLLFASTPADPDEIEARGIPLLVSLARRRPDIEIFTLWRRWGSLADARRRLAALDPPRNFIVEERDARDMAHVYAGAHATVCLYAAGHGKSAPNSVVEGLAAGRPALLADTCGIADLVAEAGAGVSAPRDLDALCAAVDRLRAGYDGARQRARELAERELDERVTVRRYASLYRELAAERVM
jgi:glycosyltransferase involved in cell wall biosynthesis